ncbi:hypothetical protein ACRQU7_16745 [Caproiciproducens sp. R1]|uniref:hypothetical protein n=1 Tax=Caproiciproducens sp. R1 TaxID=3435000 RepID=UPI004034C5A2
MKRLEKAESGRIFAYYLNEAVYSSLVERIIYDNASYLRILCCDALRKFGDRKQGDKMIA